MNYVNSLKGTIEYIDNLKVVNIKKDTLFYKGINKFMNHTPLVSWYGPKNISNLYSNNLYEFILLKDIKLIYLSDLTTLTNLLKSLDKKEYNILIELMEFAYGINMTGTMQQKYIDNYNKANNANHKNYKKERDDNNVNIIKRCSLSEIDSNMGMILCSYLHSKYNVDGIICEKTFTCFSNSDTFHEEIAIFNTKMCIDMKNKKHIQNIQNIQNIEDKEDKEDKEDTRAVDIAILLSTASVLEYKKDYDAMIVAYKQAIELGSHVAIYELAKYFDKINDLNKAVLYYEKLNKEIKEIKEIPDITFNLIDCYKRNKDINNYTMSLNVLIFKNNKKAILEMAEYYKEQEDYNKMIELYFKMLLLGEENIIIKIKENYKINKKRIKLNEDIIYFVKNKIKEYYSNNKNKIEKYIMYLDLLAEHKDMTSIMKLGNYYQYDDYNMEKMLYYYNMASQFNNTEAQEKIKSITDIDLIDLDTNTYNNIDIEWKDD